MKKKQIQNDILELLCYIEDLKIVEKITNKWPQLSKKCVT